MSIEVQPRPLPADAEVTGSQSEAILLQELIGDTVENVTEWHVPASYEAAQDKVKELRSFERSVDARITNDPEFAESFDTDMLGDLHTIASMGMRNWTLNKETVSEFGRVLDARRVMGPKGLSDEMRNRMQRYAAHYGLVGEAEQLLGFKKHVKARLDLNADIVEHKRQAQKDTMPVTSATQNVHENGANAAEVTDEKIVEETSADASVARSRRSTHATGASPYAKGDGMLHVTKEPVVVERAGTVTSGTSKHGKSRRVTREATSLGQAKAESVSQEVHMEPEVTYASINHDNYSRPAYVDPDIWDTFDDTQKRIASDPRSDVARRAARVLRPDNVPIDAWEGRPLYEQVRIADYYDGHTANAPRSDAKPRYFGFWNEEQEAAIEYLKKPLPKSRHDMDSRRGRKAYEDENRTPASEQIGRVARHLGQEALKAVAQVSDASEALLVKAAPIAKKSLKTSLRAAMGATKKGIALDERMIQRNLEIERGIGRLVLAAAERVQLRQKGKHTGAYVANRLKQIDEWLDEE